MLTEALIKNADVRERKYKLTDRNGMFLLVHPNGSKYFRLGYRLAGVPRELALGVWPRTTLAEARRTAEDARRQVKQGIDPVAAKRAQKRPEPVAPTFKDVADEWQRVRRPAWSPKYASRVSHFLERDLRELGQMPVNKVTLQDILPCIRRTEARAPHQAAKALGVTREVLQAAVIAGHRTDNPIVTLRGARVVALAPATHHAAITDPARLGALLRACCTYQGKVVGLALQILAHTAVRPGVLRQAVWPEVDLEGALWSIPAGRMKMRQPLVVPLSKQVVSKFQELKTLTDRPPNQWVCEGARTNRPISDATLCAALRAMGFPADEHQPHGFRATFRTLADEELGERIDLIEHQLAHQVRDPTGRAYNRTAHLQGRREMMQRWSHYLDSL
jgi:integrase